MAPGGRTPWSALEVAAIADMVDTMGAEQAAADVAALKAAILRAVAAADKVRSVFAETAGTLKGDAASKGEASASALADAVIDSAIAADSARSSLQNVASTLAATKAKGPSIRAAAQAIAKSSASADSAGAADEIRAAVASAMDTAYSDPMLAAGNTVVPDSRDFVSFGGGGGASPPGASAPDSPRAPLSDTPSSSTLLSGTPGTTTPTAAARSETVAAQNPASTTPASTPHPATTPSTDNAAKQNGGPGGPSGPPPGPRSPSPVVPLPNLPAAGARPTGGIGGLPTGRLGGAVPRLGVGPTGALAAPRLSATTTAGPVGAGTPMRSTPGSGMRAGGMPLVPRSGRSDDDEDRRAANYLRVRENAEEVVGELPLVGPAVLGEPEPPPQEQTPEGAAKQ
ncbi:hypothetical protein [Gordonia sp. (in: high G+C Gram-positive bacteria)]|uniref:hypothetical protein n=1 Tax=Gordonia sp. (in: high G+C Gram-positive bacteria) TaxID=84139 RepID=UPI0039E43FD7